MSRNAQSLVGVLVAVLIGGLVAWAGGSGAATVGPVSVVVLCAAVAYAVNWVAFVPAYLGQTERFYDLTGTLTYLTVVVLALVLGGGGARPVLPPRSSRSGRCVSAASSSPASRRTDPTVASTTSSPGRCGSS